MNFDLHEAAEQGDIETLTKLLDSGVDVNSNPYPIGFGTALHNAVRMQQLESIRMLLSRGADSEILWYSDLDGQQYTPLMWAVRDGHLEIVELLLEHGASMEPKEGTELGPLGVAAVAGQTLVMKLLLERQPIPSEEERSRALYFAAANWTDTAHRLETIQMLLKAGVDKKRLDLAMLLLSSRGSQFCLYDFPNDVELTTEDLQLQITIIRLLLEAGADVNAIGYGKETALDNAITEDNIALLQLLNGYEPSVDLLSP